MRRLRAKLGPGTIETVRGAGYKLVSYTGDELPAVTARGGRAGLTAAEVR